jgi:hypothetical protein
VQTVGAEISWLARRTEDELRVPVFRAIVGEPDIGQLRTRLKAEFDGLVYRRDTAAAELARVEAWRSENEPAWRRQEDEARRRAERSRVVIGDEWHIEQPGQPAEPEPAAVESSDRRPNPYTRSRVGRSA